MKPRIWITGGLNLLKWLVVPGKYDHLSPVEITARRRKNARYLIIGLIGLFSLMTLASLMMQDTGLNSPVSNNLAVALVLNLLILLLVVMALLVARNLLKLYFERRGGIAGSKLQTKLVTAFFIMTLVPALFMFAVASELIADTVDKWLNSRIERTLRDSLQVAESLYSESERDTRAKAEYLTTFLDVRGQIDTGSSRGLTRLLYQKLQEYNVDLLQVYDHGFALSGEAVRPGTELSFSLEDKPDILAKVALGEAVTEVEDSGGKNLVISIAPAPSEEGRGKVKGVVVVAREVSKNLIERARSITKGFEDYRQLAMKKELIKTSYQVTLALVSLVIVFSSIWIGFYIARGITVPLKTLAEAAEEVARGNLDVRINTPARNDEAGALIDAFNNMTHDLKSSKGQLESANKSLIETNIELHRWGQYMEAVLDNVAGGVVSINKGGGVTTINGYAARMFGVTAEDVRGKNYRKVFGVSLSAPMRQMIREMAGRDERSMARELETTLKGQRRTLKASVSMLRGHDGRYMGSVMVFDDLTDLIFAQRAIALREMARALAHEIKNPLTPIQLNVQRMRRKFQQKTEDFPKVFDDATNTIIHEVEELKGLVEKFSNMAKMADAPQPDGGRLARLSLFELRKEPTVLHDIIQDVLRLYAGTRVGITINTSLDPSIKLLKIDPEQIKRVLVNLFENAMDAMDGEGSVTVRTRAIKEKGRALIEVADTGEGVIDDLKRRIFTPYFSTKPGGSGLGLAIVTRVVEDHGGTITVAANKPKGAVFSIELPLE
jgi:two-component system nitrogen regulation sensor histidine kinase NtrY